MYRAAEAIKGVAQNLPTGGAWGENGLILSTQAAAGFLITWLKIRVAGIPAATSLIKILTL